MSKIIKGYEPHFDIDLDYGKIGETSVNEQLGWIASAQSTIEVKRKRAIDLWIYVETSHDPSRTGNYVPSGLAVTTALVWAIVIEETGISIFIPTMLLREMITDASAKDVSTRVSDCPTRGKLISLAVMLDRLKRRQSWTSITASDIQW